MRILSWLIFAVFFSFCAFAKVDSAALPFSIVVIDHDAVIMSSEAFLKVKKMVESRRKQDQDLLDAKEEELRSLENELRIKEGKVSIDEFSKMRESFESKIDETQRFVAERKQKLDDALNGFRAKIVEKAMEIIKRICADRSISVVLPKSQVIYAVDALDITSEVVSALNIEFNEVMDSL